MKKIIKLLLVILWMGLIFSFSSDPADISTKKSDGVIIKTIEFILDKNLSNQEKEKWILILLSLYVKVLIFLYT